MTVHIDESPPSLSFQPQNPGDPTALVVDTSDTESGVAGGSIEMAPAGTSDWTSLPTSFDGSHLLAHFDDAGLSGAYSFQATSCDNVGNCASTTRQLSLPLREASDSQVSLTRIVNPLQRRIVREQVRVGWHWATVRRHHKLVRVKRGGRLKTINVVKYVERCTTKRVRTARHGLAGPADLPRAARSRNQDAARAVRPQGHAGRPVHHRIGGAAARPAGAHPRRARQQLRRLHPDRGRHHRSRTVAGRRRCRPAPRGSSVR